jgi:hypothetical protein
VWSYSLPFHGPALLPFAGTFSQAQKLYVGVDAASLANSDNTTLRTMGGGGRADQRPGRHGRRPREAAEQERVLHRRGDTAMQKSCES